jgi:hypothetical protein
VRARILFSAVLAISLFLGLAFTQGKHISNLGITCTEGQIESIYPKFFGQKYQQLRIQIHENKTTLIKASSFNILRASSYFVDGCGVLHFCNLDSGASISVATNAEQRLVVDLSDIADYDSRLLSILFIFCSLFFGIFLAVSRKEIRDELAGTIKNNKVLCTMFVLFSIFIFIIFYPTLNCFDDFIILANDLKSDEYHIGYFIWLFLERSIGFHNTHLLTILLFLASAYNTIHLLTAFQKQNWIKWFFFIVCLTSPAVVLMLMGEQRFYIAPAFLFASLSFLLRFYTLHSPLQIESFFTAFILFACSFAIRPDFIIFLPFFLLIICTDCFLKRKSKLVLLIFSCLISAIFLYFFPLMPSNKDVRNEYSLKNYLVMIHPYVKCTRDKDHVKLVEILDELGGYENYCAVRYPWQFRFAYIPDAYLKLMKDNKFKTVIGNSKQYLSSFFWQRFAINPKIYIKFCFDKFYITLNSMFRLRDKYKIFPIGLENWPDIIKNTANMFLYDDYGKIHRSIYHKTLALYTLIGQNKLTIGYITFIFILVLIPCIARKNFFVMYFNLFCIFYTGAIVFFNPSPGVDYLVVASVWVVFFLPWTYINRSMHILRERK